MAPCTDHKMHCFESGVTYEVWFPGDDANRPGYMFTYVRAHTRANGQIDHEFLDDTQVQMSIYDSHLQLCRVRVANRDE
jgi:hypothetical protein